jgi:hypothetical protein
MTDDQGHKWTEQCPRTVKIDGKVVLHRRCASCGRDFARMEQQGDWKAVYVGVFRLEPLAQEIGDRWLAERCPEQRLVSDDSARANYSATRPRVSGGMPP